MEKQEKQLRRSCQPGSGAHHAKQRELSTRNVQQLQGPGTAGYDRVAFPGTTRHWALEEEEACGRLERSLSLRRWDALVAGGLTVCHAPGGSPTLGRLANEGITCERREDCQLG